MTSDSSLSKLAPVSFLVDDLELLVEPLDRAQQAAVAFQRREHERVVVVAQRHLVEQQLHLDEPGRPAAQQVVLRPQLRGVRRFGQPPLDALQHHAGAAGERRQLLQLGGRLLRSSPCQLRDARLGELQTLLELGLSGRQVEASSAPSLAVRRIGHRDDECGGDHVEPRAHGLEQVQPLPPIAFQEGAILGQLGGRPRRRPIFSGTPHTVTRQRSFLSGSCSSIHLRISGRIAHVHWSRGQTSSRGMSTRHRLASGTPRACM